MQALLFLKLDWVPLLSLGLSRSGLLAFVTYVFVSKRLFALPKHSSFCLAFVGLFLLLLLDSPFFSDPPIHIFFVALAKKAVD